jgi:hypothetical protein
MYQRCKADHSVPTPESHLDYEFSVLPRIARILMPSRSKSSVRCPEVKGVARSRNPAAVCQSRGTGSEALLLGHRGGDCV